MFSTLSQAIYVPLPSSYSDSFTIEILSIEPHQIVIYTSESMVLTGGEYVNKHEFVVTLSHSLKLATPSYDGGIIYYLSLW